MNKTLFILILLFTCTEVSAQQMHVRHHKDSVHVFQLADVDSVTFTPCPDSLILEALAPNIDCVTVESRPTFTWKHHHVNRPIIEWDLRIKVVEMDVSDTSFEVFDKKPPIVDERNIKTTSFTFPSNIEPLKMGKIYAWRVQLFDNDTLVATSEIKPFFIIDYKLPFDIRETLCCIGNPLSGNWQAAYGTPTFKSDDDGCNGPGYVQLQGNSLSGSAITQTLAPLNRIQQGRHYRFSACVRLRDMPKAAQYVMIKAVAYNSTIPPTGVHPQPSSDLAIIGWSGRMSLKEWATMSLPVWRPNKNFDKVAVYCYTGSPDTTTYCEVDNLCLVETTDSVPCDDYVYDSNGSPIIDGSLTGAATDTTYHYYDEYVGLTSDLYSGQGNTALDTWYPDNDSCSSVGGIIPPELDSVDVDDSLAALGFEGTTEDLDSLLSEQYTDTTQQRSLPGIPPIQNPCTKPFVVDNTQPFGGRDIVFVHGLNLDHLCDRASNEPGALRDWPTDLNEFRSGGYYKTTAENTWADHIKTWLTSRGHKNRYLVVAYNCNQPLKVAAHAVLAQIRQAMATGEGVVVTDPRDTRGKECFGASMVVISHSTGGLVTDVAMSIAEQSKTNASVQAEFGNVGYIPDRTKAHVAFHSIFSGSKMATIFLAAQHAQGLGNLLNAGVCESLKAATPLMYTITHSSILVDLQPMRVTTHWAPYIHSTPVPTITIAGGHPLGVDGLGILNWAIHPGLDDGVSTMSSQAGNPNFETGATPSGYFRAGNAFQVYDMGISSGRANSYYMHQTLFTPFKYIGSGAVTHLSATGMVQPVGPINPVTSCENRYINHYSFIQSASDHYIGPRGNSVKDGFDPNNFPGSSGFDPQGYSYDNGYGRNYEESRAITDLNIYSRGLVSGAVANMQQERLKGLYITLTIPIPNFSVKCCPLKFKFWWSYYYIIIPIWERKYHNMVGFENECECSYVYKYVLRP